MVRVIVIVHDANDEAVELLASLAEVSLCVVVPGHTAHGDESVIRNLPVYDSVEGLSHGADVILNIADDAGTKAALEAERPLRSALLDRAQSLRLLAPLAELWREVRELRDMRRLFEAIINATEDAISVVDDAGRGILINPAYTRITGLTEADVIGQPADVDIAEGESMHMRALTTGQSVRNAQMKVGPHRRDVVVNVAPIVVAEHLRGSVAVIHDVSDIRRLSDELAQARARIRKLESKYTFSDIVGRSEAMKVALEAAMRAAHTPATVLLRGESGCGKELFAHAIHHASDRSRGQFVRVNCAALTETLLESELFGYVEGAFSGARKGGRKGLFEEADHGTLFLDEIAELSPGTQAKILRVLQEKEIVRVGSSQSIAVDTRVIAATHRDLEAAMAAGRFREDLYYRLNVLPIPIPPLRDRLDDVEPLVWLFVRKFNHDFGRNVRTVSPDAWAKLRAYRWPGNVRELENVVGRAMIRLGYQDATIDAGRIDLPSSGVRTNSVHLPTAGGGSPTLAVAVSAAERAAIEAALRRAGGRRAEAARLLDVSIRTLHYKMKAHGVHFDAQDIARNILQM
jgi:PAS domain S-box-containing protein